MKKMRCILLAFISAQALRVPLPHLRARRLSRAIKPLHSPLSTSAAVLYAAGTTPDAAAIEPEPAQRGLRAILQSPETKKVVPLALIFFCILFNYTILRDTKDVLVVTAPKSGAEIIPFLKTYVNLPGAIAFTVLYGSLSNRFSQPQVFRGVVSTFLGFFAAFAWVLYPNIGGLHPHGLADSAARILPGSFQAPIAVIRNWTFSLFYLAAELWGSVVASLLFWGFANSVLYSVPPSRHRCASSPGMMEVGGLCFDVEAVQTESRVRRRRAEPRRSSPSTRPRSTTRSSVCSRTSRWCLVGSSSASSRS